LIDPALRRAGWDVGNPAQVGLEIPVDGFDPQAWQALKRKLDAVAGGRVAYDAATPAGISDYALYRPNGEVIAVVEAKRTSTDPRLAEAQTEFYVSEIEKRQSFRPFAFMTNGYEIYFWDVGEAVKRSVAGFFAPDDLENLLFIRQNRMSLGALAINRQITDRGYQQEAIRRVGEAFEQGRRRRALLVMATGTGKTRTAMSLVDLMLRGNWARRILFVADRDALVEQALGEGFKRYLPNEPCTRIASQHIPTSSRLYAVTLQTLSNCFEAFSPGFFDLIIFDEVHRSIFNKWNEVLLYFDARMVGLTATPAEFIDRNTFREFYCDGSRPTFLYSYRQAVAEGYLVDFDLYAAKTRFQRKGIRGVDLSEEERNMLIEQGIDPDSLDYSGTDLEKTVSNRDTLRRQWEEIWDTCVKDRSGQLPGKTIVFAMTQEHALRLADVFEEMYPQFPGLVRVVTYKSEFRRRLIEQFKKESLPRIAITVDLLETGIDVPEAVNLVFMRPVQSRIKLEQMLGRGTRCQAACHSPEWLPQGQKKRFLVIDFWENDFRKAEGEPAQSLPVLVSLFNTRLELVDEWRERQSSPECQRTIADLRALVALIPTDSFSVRRVLPEVAEVWADGWWRWLTPSKLDLLYLKVGPLLRFAPGTDVEAATFTHKVERLKLQIVRGGETEATAASIAEDVGRLPDFVFEDAVRREWAELCLTPGLQTATPAQLTGVCDALADQMKYRRGRENTFLLLDLPDYVETRGYILLRGGSERVYVEEYRRRVEQRILDLAERDETLQRIRRGEAVSDLELVGLERTLREELGGASLELSEDKIRKAYGLKVGSLIEFLRQMLELEGIADYREIVRRQFEGFIAARPFNADQIRFLRAVQSVFQQKRRLERADLYGPPLTAFGAGAVERWFTEAQVAEILALAEGLAA